MDKYVLYHDLRDALQHGTCAVCTLVEQRIDRAVKVILREGFTDTELRGSYIRAKGYCNHHAWQVREAGDPVAHAVMYRGLLEQHRASLELFMNERNKIGEAVSKESPVQRIRSILQGIKEEPKKKTDTETVRYLDSFSSNNRCPLCEMARSCELRYVESIIDYYEGDEDFKERYRNRGVLCHPHLRQLIQNHPDRAILDELLEIQLGRLDTYIEHLTEIEKKANYSYSEADIGAERGGWIRAVHLDVGVPGTDTSYKLKLKSGNRLGDFVLKD
ncbi:DUF6062 family protein [Paenibacillus alkalitolerans]|uniref:DUF6062 family protein n=1 Tax=Paenibacillus alkalitolerans TaxID=2799335 RepID=UPI0018F4A59F|nr:DUF6062 family protein [Paenibacillus alkalitolerans]